MKNYILAIDAGTTSSRAILFDQNGSTIGTAQHEFTQHFPKESWVEHDAIEIWETQLMAIREVLEKTDTKASQIHAMGITNQRETTVLWNRKTGKPVHNAIVWQDRRTASICDDLSKKGKSTLFFEKTGLLLDAYFSGTKIKWILDQNPELKKQAQNGELAFGTIDSWLIWNLTGGKVHVTDVTNASRTLLYNIHTLEWDKELLDTLEVPESLLPKVVSSSEVVGVTQPSLFDHEILIAGIAGDQQALEGSVFVAGAVVQWLRDQLRIINSAPEIEKLAKTVENNGGVTFIPALAGLGAPYWDPHATASILGITRGTEKGHIARAALEAIAMRTREIVIEMQKDANTTFRTLKVDGGGSTNDLLMQIQSDLLQTEVIRPETTETTALGAAFFAGLATQYWPSIESLSSIWKANKKFTPRNEIQNEKIIAAWNKRMNQLTNL